MSIHGSLSSVHCSLDLERYQLIRGLLDNNLGEPVEEFLRPYNLQDPSSYVRTQPVKHKQPYPHLQHPVTWYTDNKWLPSTQGRARRLNSELGFYCKKSISEEYFFFAWLQTVLSGDVYTSLSFLVDMMNVSLELFDKPNASAQKCSLARWVFGFLCRVCVVARRHMQMILLR